MRDCPNQPRVPPRPVDDESNLLGAIRNIGIFGNYDGGLEVESLAGGASLISKIIGQIHVVEWYSCRICVYCIDMV